MLDRLQAAWQAFRNSDSSESSAAAAPESDEPAIGRPAWKTWNGQLRQIKAAFEAGMIRDDLWTLADFKDADATLLPHIRRRIRSRARFETANNPQVDRVLNVWVDDVVSETGPWPKLQTGNTRVDNFIEQAWMRWWAVSGQAGKLRLAVKAEASDGESVAVLFSNMRIVDDQAPGSAVSVDVAGFECDRLADPNQSDSNRSDYVDGVHLDPWTREPVAYDLLKAHPGTEYLDQASEIYDFQKFPRHEVLHCFRKNRAEQNRGNCRYVSALAIAGLLRKYAEAEVSRMGTIAAHVVLYKSSAPPEEDDEGGDESNWWQEVALPARKGVAGILPEGFDPVQLKNDGQAAELQECRDLVAGLIAGCFSMPLGRAIGKSSEGGYPGMRADLLPYHKAIASDRSQIWEPGYLKPLYRAFLQELRATAGWRQLMEEVRGQGSGGSEQAGSFSLASFPSLDLHNVAWRWPDRDLVVDPSREGEAKRKDMSMGLRLRSDEIDAADLDAHDLRGGRELGLTGSDDEIRQQYRQLCAKSIHQLQTLEEGKGDSGQGKVAGMPGEGG